MTAGRTRTDAQAPARSGRAVALAVAVLVALATTAAGYAVETAGATDAETLGPGVVTVTMDVEHSRFSPERLQVRQGTLVRFVVRNADPIHHELVVGPDEVHRQHATGTELVHPPVPGEVSVGPNETGMTFYRFDEPGTVRFACHLPGHAEYGMVGEVEIVR